MQVKFVTTIFVLFTVLLMAFLVNSYFNAEKGGTYGNVGVAALPNLPTPRAVDTSKEQTTSMPLKWLGGLSQKKRQDYIYPAPEVQLHLSLIQDRTDTKDFRVRVKAIDSYQFFCLNQVLTAHKIEYSYYRMGNGVELVINAKNEDYIKEVLEKLKYYEINYEFVVA